MQAIVMGRNYMSLLSMARSVGMAGCDVVIIRMVREMPATNLKSRVKQFLKGGSVDGQCKYVKKYCYAIEPDRESLIRTIKAYAVQGKKSILIPTDDFTASTVDYYLNDLKNDFYCPSINGEAGKVVAIMDKETQKNMAQSVGLPVARAWKVVSQKGQFTIPEDIEYPCFTKPEISFMGSKTYMKRCNNEKELEQLLSDVSRKGDCPILVEQYIDIEEEYGVLGFCDKDDIIVPGIVIKVLTGNGNHKGVTMIGDYIPLPEDDPLKKSIVAFLKEINFVGLIDIDLYKYNGVVYFNELNMRLGAFGFAAMCAGINLPGMMINSLVEDKHEHLYSFEHPVRCINEKVNYDDFVAGYLTYEQYVQNREKCDCGFIEYEADLRPFKVFKRQERITVAKRKASYSKKRNEKI